ncbi:MAG TPA: type II secretion system F family protein [Bacilli bacterium]|nr:type II secretion system F family protein [Bacilli bacterium]
MLDILLLPFIIVYRVFIVFVKAPYYFLIGLKTIFIHKVKKEKKLKEKTHIQEKKVDNTKLIIKEEKLKYKKAKEEEKRAKIYAKLLEKKKLDEAKKIEIEAKQKEKNELQERLKREKNNTLINNQIIIEAKKKDKEKRKEERKKSKGILGVFLAFYNNLSFVKNRQNELEMKKEMLLSEFNNKKEERGTQNILYKYLAKNSAGLLERGSFEALSKIDVQSFLMSEGYEVYEITPVRSAFHSSLNKMGLNGFKFKKSALIFYLTQLSAYIKAGIPLAEAVKIISEQSKNDAEKKTWKAIVYDITMGESFSNALEKRGQIFPKLLINMIKTSEMTGNLTEVLDDMANYYLETEKTRKQMISAMMYPAIVFIFSITVITFILMWVVPQFTSMYKDLGSNVPGITIFIINISDFLRINGLYLFIGIILVLLIYTSAYKSLKGFRLVMQSFFMRIPVIGNIIIYNEVTMFTKTFANLINHNVFITDSIEILSKITDNEVYKLLVMDTITNLAKGETISSSFSDQWAFPNLAYQMLITGERTGRLGNMMERVSKYYQDQHSTAITRMKALMEPVLIVFLTGIVGFILLSIIIPMFGMYNAL